MPASPARLRRVADGRRSLARWLSDVARDGWGARSEDAEGLDAMARRMVDAQAPGLGRRVEALALQRHEPAAVAKRVGALHLLLEAYARVERLPEGLAADVESMVGLSTRKKQILDSGERIQDRWWVLGAVTVEEDDLVSRRTWLLGQGSGRPGLILDFAPPAGALPPPLTAGSVYEGEVAFYPSAAPLRCLLVPPPEDRATAEPSSPPDPRELQRWLGSLSSVWKARSEQLVEQPWLTRTLVGVEGLSPRRVLASGEGESAWALVDAEGFGLRIAGGTIPALALLAVGGGRPVSVFGELEQASLRPLAVFEVGEADSSGPATLATGLGADPSIGPEPRPADRSSSEDGDSSVDGGRPIEDPVLDALWGALLVGTHRARLPSARGLEPAWSRVLERAAPDPEGQARALLDGLALAFARARVGTPVPRVSEPAASVDSAPEADLAPAPPRAAEALARLLDSPAVPNPLLEVGLEACARAGWRAPSATLPELLDLAAQHRAVRPAVLEVLGARGRWLAGLQPRWAFAATAESKPEDAARLRARCTEARTAADRRPLLEALRRVDPTAAAEAIAEVWPRLGARDRLDLIDALDPVAPVDEALLETALDDRAKTVRAAAADRLACLPGSALVRRLQDRLRTTLVLEDGALSLRPPSALAPEELRDGIVTCPPGAERARRRSWVEQAVARVPPGHWTARFELAPQAILAAADRGGVGPGLRLAWTGSTLRHLDSRWAAALLEAGVTAGEGALLRVLAAPAREAWLKRRMSSAPSPDALYRVLGSVAELPGPISTSLARATLVSLGRLVRASPGRPWPAHGILRRLAVQAELEDEDGPNLFGALAAFEPTLLEGSALHRAAVEALELLRERRALLAVFGPAKDTTS